MSERVPPLSALREAFARCHPFRNITEVEERYAEFDRRIAEVERAAAEKAWDEGHASGRDYQADGWNSDAHDPKLDNPYRLNEGEKQ